jgi:histidine ammonia-lyase
VSMACHGARRLTEMNHNLAHIIAIELMISTQGVEFRAPINTSSELQRVMAVLRTGVAALEGDRYLADDIAWIKQMVFDRQFIAALADATALPRLE